MPPHSTAYSQQAAKNRVAQAAMPTGARTVILHLAPDVEPDDPGRETVDLAVLTQRAGWRAIIASSGGRLVKVAERAAVRHRRIPFDNAALFGEWRSRFALEGLILKERPSIIHAHGIETLPFAQALARAQQLPLIADLTQPFTATPRLQKIFAQMQGESGMLRVPTEYMARFVQDNFQYPSEKIAHIPAGVDLVWHNAGFISPERLSKLSALWRLPEQASIALVPMPLAPDMGHRVFLEALAKLKQEAIFAVLVGSDRHAPGFTQEVEGMLARYGLAGRVVMPDYCLDWPAACWMSSVVVAPNTVPRGQTPELLAAQAIGRPVIITDIGAAKEMVRVGETAWVVQPGNVAALTDALREAIRLTTDQRLVVAANTQDFIAEAFPQNVWFDSMMQMYDSLLRPAERSNRAAA